MEDGGKEDKMEDKEDKEHKKKVRLKQVCQNKTDPNPSHSDGKAGTAVQHLNRCRHCQEPWSRKVPSTCMALILRIIKPGSKSVYFSSFIFLLKSPLQLFLGLPGDHLVH